MANIGVELKRLLTKLGGTPSKYDQTNELLHKITDQVNAGGSGGGGVVLIQTESDEGGYRLTKTFGEIYDAFKSGKQCLLEDVYSDEQTSSETYENVSSVGFDFSSYSGRYTARVNFRTGGSYNAEAGTLDALRAEYPFQGS